ncbi:MAG: hypothetical protein PF517_18100 [Salinivirgaceae bacterium]|jgi:hypothetical protein|nr:hypothetical protein [Salinivirgaceae bacterium]
MHRKSILRLSFLLSVLFVSCTQEIDKPTAKEISPYLFGQNLWLTAGAEGRSGYIEQSLWPKVEASGAKIIRIGGNGYEHSLPGYDTLDTWVKSIKAIGAEPLFQVSRVESAKKAAELVKHFNKDTDMYIKYWCIGNEPYQLGKWTIDSISSYIKSHSTAMKLVDPKIKIFAPDAAAYYNDLYEALLISDRHSVAGRDSNGNWYIDGVTFHNYPNGKNYSRTDVINYSVSKMRGMILNLLEDVEASNKKYQRFGDDKLLWGLTEFNITYRNPDDHGIGGIAVPSFINGQFWADVYAMAMEYDAFCVTPWCIQESDRKSTYFGYIGGPPDFIPHSTYYHMQLMAENFSGEFVKMTTNNPFVKAFASKSSDVSTVMLMNQSMNEIVEFDLSKINKGTDGLNITSEIVLKTSHKGEIKPNSTIILVFDNSGALNKQILYDITMASENQEPQIIN